MKSDEKGNKKEKRLPKCKYPHLLSYVLRTNHAFRSRLDDVQRGKGFSFNNSFQLG